MSSKQNALPFLLSLNAEVSMEEGKRRFGAGTGATFNGERPQATGIERSNGNAPDRNA